MDSRFSLKHQKSDGEVIFYLAGHLDETSVMPDVSAVLQGSESKIFDFNELSRINSVGILKWSKWLDENNLRQTSATVKNCRPFLIDLCNSFEDLIPKSWKFSSFYVPYFNEKSDSEVHSLVEIEGKNISGVQDIEALIPTTVEQEGIIFERDFNPETFFRSVLERL